MSKQLRKSDIRDLNSKLPIELDKKSLVSIAEDALLVNDELTCIRIDDVWIPAIPLLLKQPDLLAEVVVDMGAVRFVVNGADIMRPGIQSLPDKPEGSFVVVVDEDNTKPLAVGRLLVSGQEARKQSSGRVVENIHYVSDEYWEKFVTNK